MTADTASVSSSSSNGSSPRQNSHQRQQPKRHPIREVEALSEEQLQQYVALDCEMIGVGENGRYSALARVTIIDWYGNILMDDLVKQEQEVTDYRTFVSGITPDMLAEAQMDLPTCRQKVLDLLEGKVLIGHGLKNDLRVLNITHPWYMTRDTAKYEPFMKVRFEDGILWPRALKDLCHEKLHREMQVYGKPHCPVEDALAALDLYRSVRCKWEKAMEYKINKTRDIEARKLQQKE